MSLEYLVVSESKKMLLKKDGNTMKDTEANMRTPYDQSWNNLGKQTVMIRSVTQRIKYSRFRAHIN